LEILDTTNSNIKKKLENNFDSTTHVPKIIKYLKVALKFITSVLHLRTYKHSKLKQIISEGEVSIKDSKNIDVTN
jgi:hypothetical protein